MTRRRGGQTKTARSAGTNQLCRWVIVGFVFWCLVAAGSGVAATHPAAVTSPDRSGFSEVSRTARPLTGAVRSGSPRVNRQQLAPFNAPSGASGPGYVESTLDLENNSSIPGLFVPPSGYPGGGVVDPRTGTVWIGTSSGLVGFNGTSDTIDNSFTFNQDDLLDVGLDPVHDQLYAPQWFQTNATVIDASNLTVAGVVPTGSDGIDAAYDPSTGDMYIVNYGSGTVTVVNTSSLTVVATIPVAAYPFSIAFDPSMDEAFVSDGGAGKISVINTTTLQWIGNIWLSGGGLDGPEPTGVAFDPLTGKIWFAEYAAGVVVVLNPNNATVNCTISVGPNPWGLVYDPATQIMFASNAGDGVSVINATTYSVVAPSIPANGPEGLILDPLSDELFVSDGGAETMFDDVIVANATSYETITTLSTGGPYLTGMFDNPVNRQLVAVAGFEYLLTLNATASSIQGEVGFGSVQSDPNLIGAFDGTYNPQDGLIWVGFTYGDQLVGLYPTNYSAATVVTIYPSVCCAGPDAIALDPANGTMFVTEANTHFIDVVDSTTYQVVDRIQVGQYPAGITYDAAQNDVFVSNSGTDNVTVVNASSYAVIASIPVGSGPQDIAYDASDGEVFVADYGSSSVSVINASSDQVVQTVSVGGSPLYVAVDAFNSVVYVTDSSTDLVTAIDDRTNEVAASIEVVPEPTGIYVNQSTGDAFVATYGSGAISVLAPCATPSCLEIERFSATPSSLDLGNQTDLSVVTDFGVGSLTYEFQGLPPGCTSASESTLDCVPTEPGSFNVSVSVTDATGDRVTANLTLNVSVLAPAISSFTVSPGSVYLQQSISVEVAASQGYGWLSYGYEGLPTGCQSENLSSFECTPSATGSFLVTAVVSNSYGVTSMAWATVTVLADPVPEILGFGASPSEIYLGSSSTLSVDYSNGYGWLRFAYSGLPPGCTSGNSSSLECVPTSPGDYRVVVTLTNEFGLQTEAGAWLNVSALPAAPAISSYTAQPSNFYLGQTTTLSVTADGFELSYNFSGLPPGCESINQSSLSCTPSAAGNFSVTVAVSDPFGRTATDTLLLEIVVPPLLRVTAFTASAVTIALGSATQLQVDVSGAVGAPSYSYSGLPPGCVSQNASELTCRPSELGNYSITVTVTDQLNRSAARTLEIIVLAAGSVEQPRVRAPLWPYYAAAGIAVGAVVVLGVALYLRRRA